MSWQLKRLINEAVITIENLYFACSMKYLKRGDFFGFLNKALSIFVLQEYKGSITLALVALVQIVAAHTNFAC